MKTNLICPLLKKKKKRKHHFFYIYEYENCLPWTKPWKEVNQECFSLLISFFGIHKVIMVLSCFEGQRSQRNRILNCEINYKSVHLYLLYTVRMEEILRNFKTSRDPSHWVRSWSSDLITVTTNIVKTCIP